MVQARGRVAQRLVGDFTPQQVVGLLLLLDLFQRGAQLRLALQLGRQVGPDAAQPAAPGFVGHTQHAEHREFAPHAAPFEAVFAGQRRAMRQRRLFGSSKRGRQRCVEQFGAAAPRHFGRWTAQKRRHGRVHANIATVGCVLHGEQVAAARQQFRHQAAQQKPQSGFGERRADRQFGHGGHFWRESGQRSQSVSRQARRRITPSWCDLALRSSFFGILSPSLTPSRAGAAIGRANAPGACTVAPRSCRYPPYSRCRSAALAQRARHGL